MYNPFTGYINQIQNNQTVANQSSKSIGQRLMLNTKSINVPSLLRPPMSPLNFVDSSSLRSTYKNPFQTNTNLNATVNRSQTLYQPQTAPNISLPAILPSSSSTVVPTNHSSVNTQNYTVPFVAMNKSVKTFVGLDHQYTPEEYLHQTDAHTILTMGE